MPRKTEIPRKCVKGIIANFVSSPISHPPTQNVYRHDSEAAEGKQLEIGNNIFHAAFLIFVISDIKRDGKFQVEHIVK